ncbi:MAG: hypothetical protein ABSG91_00840 [Syntrophobacteraceae bacterium]
MKSRSRGFVTLLVVFLSIGIFAVAGCLQAAENDQATKEGQKAITEGAKQMMDGNKAIMDIMAKKGVKDPDLTTAEKMMTDGMNMITKGESMITAGTVAEGKTMVRHGAKMMLDAQKTTMGVVEKHGMVYECSIALDTCGYAEKRMKQGALDWFFGS